MITRHPASRTLVVRPVGHLESLMAEHYRQQLKPLVDEGYRYLIFDLEETTHINSSGLGLFVEFFNVLRRRDGALKLIHCSDQLLWILRQSRLDRLLLGDDHAAEPIAFDPLHAMMSRELLLISFVHQATELALKLDRPEEILRALLCGAMQALDSPRGAALLLSMREDQWTLAALCERGGDATERPEALAEPVLPGRLEARLLERDAVLRVDVDDAPEDGTLFRQLGFRTLWATPIFGQHRRFGILAVEAGPERADTAAFAAPLLQSLAHIGGLALQHHAAIRSLSERNEELAAALDRLQQCQTSLIDAGHLASMGAVINGLCHLLNNKMVPLVGYAQMLATAPDLPDEARRKISVIDESAREIAQIVDKMIHIARRHDEGPQRASLNEMINTVLDLLMGAIRRRRVAVQLHLASQLPELRGDVHAMLQALLAIVHNACSSFPDDGGEHWIRLATASAGDCVRLVVEDNGQPLGDEGRPDWIDPLASPEAIANGCIFSYTIPRSVVRRLHGRLTIETRPEGGKRVVVELPCVEPTGVARCIA